MTRSRLPAPGTKRRNLLALLVVAGALGALYLNFDPQVAGSDPDSYAAQNLGQRVVAPSTLAFDEDRTSALPATAVVTAEATATGTAAPQAAPTIDRKLATLLDLLLVGEGVQLPSGTTSTASADGVAAHAWDEQRAILVTNIVLLRRGLERLDRVPSYSVTFFKHERVDGQMLDEQVVRMKIRHQPFGVYMKWITGDKGRELLYNDGQNDGNLLVHAGGWKARLVPALQLDPTGSLAMKESRHPCTMAGLRNMMLKMLEDRTHDLAVPGHTTYKMLESEAFDERPCYAFLVEHRSRQHSPVYRKCLIYLDRELNVPLFVKNWGWPHEDQTIAAADLDEQTMIEHYHFTELDLATRLAEVDFDHTNSDYRFRR